MIADCTTSSGYYTVDVRHQPGSEEMGNQEEEEEEEAKKGVADIEKEKGSIFK
eukprot:CAMPEP_0175046492 /NCGR_PEP_ID=MMETSP0052_2-20121109/5062_1 /TAXON_ID=51329 ORGANISM="Polytomella parva, Strain SAG 63-3" /NCGR_SAMPLE_ID=MMETSP0052_2 /ASSEMBLY_ACC=CAM_ASM_000194 /LENGTH=52 /DNA_ID=CAMNT_0016310247 /DNA_START=141 /DNA_END=299 /DNA_ORIENTATION=+